MSDEEKCRSTDYEACFAVQDEWPSGRRLTRARMAEIRANQARFFGMQEPFGNAGTNQLQRLMSEHEAACQQAFAPRVPDVTGEGCADRSAPGAVGDIYIRTWSDVAVTQEMIAAGVQELLVAQGCVISESYWAEKIYRAMTALAPKDMFDASARDHAEAWANECMAKVAALEAERDTASAVLETTRLCIEALHDATAAKDTEIDTLKAQLAAFTAADPQPAVPDPPIRWPDGTLAPQPKPWSPPKYGGDPRRIGG